MWSALGGKGTPAFVIGNRVILAAVPYETLKEAIAHAREQK
jgi:protein-disulfide isomerase